MLLPGGSRYHPDVVNSSNLNFGLECGNFPLMCLLRVSNHRRCAFFLVFLLLYWRFRVVVIQPMLSGPCPHTLQPSRKPRLVGTEILYYLFSP